MVNKKWSECDISKMTEMLVQGHTKEEVAIKLDRTAVGISVKAQKIGLPKLYPGIDVYPSKQHIPPKTTPSGTKWRQHPKYRNYYCSEFGDVWSARAGKQLSTYWLTADKGHKKGKWVKINNKTMKVSRLVAECWFSLNDDQCVIHKDRNKGNDDIYNFIITDKKRCGKLSGHLAKRSTPVALFKDGKRVQVYRSARNAALQLGVSYQTVIDYAKGKIKKPKLDIRYY